MRRGAGCLVLVACLLLAGCSSAPLPERHQAVWLDVFDTVTVFTAYTSSREEFDRISESVHTALWECHCLFDIYHTYEGIANIRTVNEAAGERPVPVDGRIVDMLSLAQEMYALTGGRVNVCMGSVLALWHDAREAAEADPASAALPSAEALEEAARHTDISALALDREEGTAFLTDPAARLDVGAVGKGWAVEYACSLLREMGVASACLSAGGNVACVGTKPGGEKWTVAVEDPSGNGYAATLAVADMAAVTSGSYERFFTVDGIRYHHIIDPATLYPADRWVSVTVLAEDSARADALSTALFNMDEDEALALAGQLGNVELLLIRPDGTQTATEGFSAYAGN